MAIHWKSPMWNDRIAIAFGYPRDGWVGMVWISNAFNQIISFECSDVFPPFEDMVIWFEQIAANRLPATFSIDEEGVIKNISTAKSELEADAIEIKITADDARKPLLRCRTNRIDFIHEFIRRFEACARR